MIKVRFNKAIGAVRPIHGVNLGPIDRSYTYDYSEYYRKLRIPSVRTHDCAFSARDTVDLHTIFPNPNADPDNPVNYDFTQSDDYLSFIHNAGCQICYRLGESIENTRPHKKYVVGGRWKPETLAKVCVNIARHYNEGWSNGFRWNIRQWQFWNEPSNSWRQPVEKRPCWTGTAEEFYTLYGAVSRAFKAHNPEWKIGLAGYGHPDFIFPKGHPRFFEENPWRYMEDIVNAGPIDSISWHQYGMSWEDLALSTKQVRECMDAHGLNHAENHITEWNYMPWEEDEKGRYTWFHARQERDGARLKHIYEVMSGVEGATYVFGALARLQSEPVDMTHLYTGVSAGALGLFDIHGQPRKKIVGLEVFVGFLDETRVETEGGVHDKIVALASHSNKNARIAIAHLRPADKEIALNISGKKFRLKSTSQFSDNGWQTIHPNIDTKNGTIHIPISESGITVLKGEIA